jgi:hypothetical protein
LFRVTVSTHVVFGEIHYHARLINSACDRVVGILVFRTDEWTEFLRVCEAFHIQVEVKDEVPPAASAHPAS